MIELLAWGDLWGDYKSHHMENMRQIENMAYNRAIYALK